MAENRLIHEKSPYLLQHARNPVDWYPWGDEAFAAARDSDRPVFLSIGYATCHWCHVMEHESFEDEDVARLMNDAFINVKVDREERPDIDSIYMAVAQMSSGRGGWPLTILMTPERQPFFSATYIPRETRYGRLGMLDLVPRIEEVWTQNRSDVLKSAGAIQGALDRAASADQGGGELGPLTLEQGYDDFASTFDREHAGFGPAPKFPTSHRLSFLLKYWARTGEDHALHMVERTLDAMRAGGMYDQVGFGFHRYSTDTIWLLPHFEKMLYDQALLAMTYVEAFQATGAPRFERTAREILEYVRRDLTSTEGAFFSAEDADSEGEEGKFYVWGHDELAAIVGPEVVGLVTEAWGVVEVGNFVDEVTRETTGTNILHRARPWSEVASHLGLSVEEFEASLDAARVALFATREGRVRPLLDDKVLTDWNGLMIAAFARAGAVFREQGFLESAARAAQFLHQTMLSDEALLHRYRDGEARISGNLDDYAFLAWGELELHQATQDPEHLERAVSLTEQMLARFWDADRGGMFFSPEDRDDLIVRQKEVQDGAVPSGNSVAALTLLRLSRLTAESRYEQLAHEIIDAFSQTVAQHPSAYTLMLAALEFAVGRSEELVIVGDPEDDTTRAMLDLAHAGYHPGRVILVRPPGEAGERIAKLAPFLADFTSVDGKTTAYLCHGYQCERPVTEVDDLRDLMMSAGRDA